MTNSGDMVIRVYGDPRPWPKKKGGTRKMGDRTVPVPISDDYRTKTVVDTYTGKKSTKRHDIGYKMRWFTHVQQCVLAWMQERGRSPFEQHYPVALGCMYFVRKPSSSILVYPTGTPDYDNLRYGVPNVLKRTPAKKKYGVPVPGPYPDGVAFYDDSNVIYTAQPDGMAWATPANPPGVLITILDLMQHLDVLDWAMQVDKDACADVVAMGREARR